MTTLEKMKFKLKDGFVASTLRPYEQNDVLMDKVSHAFNELIDSLTYDELEDLCNELGYDYE